MTLHASGRLPCVGAPDLSALISCAGVWSPAERAAPREHAARLGRSPGFVLALVFLLVNFVARFDALRSTGLPATVESKNAKTFTPPAKDLEARIKARQLRHTGSSFLTWQVSNCCIERRRDGSMLPTKESPMSPNKVDAVDALLLALAAMLATPTVPAYEPKMFFLEA